MNTSYWSVYPSVEWKPASNFTMSVGPGVDRALEDAQYVPLYGVSAAAPGEVPADFGGRRYVFARMDQRTLSANLRLDVSFTRNLTLQTYVQPLIAAGRYGGFKALARSGSYDFVHYGRDNGSTCERKHDAESGLYYFDVDPDGNAGPMPVFQVIDPSFNIKSLRGNAVLRWEYRPGSVLYFVWTQERSDYEPVGDLRFGPSTRRLFDAQANDIFLVKATYHLNL